MTPTQAERDIDEAVIEELSLAEAEGRLPACRGVQELVKTRGWGKVAKTRVMDGVRRLGLQGQWSSRGAQLEKYIRRYCPPGKSWSQHITALHRDQRLRLQRAALERPDLAEMALDEKGESLKQLLIRSGMAAPIWPAHARAVLERTLGKRSRAGKEKDRAKERAKERRAEERREAAQMAAWRASTGSEAQSPSERKLDGKAAWKRHLKEQRKEAKQASRGEDPRQKHGVSPCDLAHQQAVARETRNYNVQRGGTRLRDII